MYARLGLLNSTRYYPISVGRLDELQIHSVVEYCKMTYLRDHLGQCRTLRVCEENVCALYIYICIFTEAKIL